MTDPGEYMTQPEKAEPMGEHTAGPWTASGGDALWGIWFRDGKARLATIDRTRDGHEAFRAAAEADARLIAAAPDLLSATRAWIEYLAEDGEGSGAQEERLLAAMRAAIAKAQGDNPNEG